MTAGGQRTGIQALDDTYSRFGFNATLVVASAGGMQVHSNETVSTFLPLVNSSTLTDSVKGNVGNVGVNLSAGIGNQQVNNVSLAVR